MRTLTLIAALLFATPAFAGKRCEFKDDDGACNSMDSVSPIQLIKKGTPYAQVRKQALAHGYTLTPTTRDASRCLPEQSKVCSTWPETIACKSAGGSDCQFLMEKFGGSIVVDTLGDGLDQRLKAVHVLNMDDQRDLKASFRQ